MTTVEPAGEPFSLRLATPSLVALVAANLVPLAGVLWFGWDLGLILQGAASAKRPVNWAFRCPCWP